MKIHRSPWARAAYRARGWRVAFLACVAVSACAPTAAPEQQVRAVIAAAETAAEERNLSALMNLVSPRYEDEQGGSAVELTRTIRGYFIVNQSVHLITRIESVEFPYKDMARVHLTVGTMGRKATASDAFDVAANVHEVQVELQLERGEWKVTRAAWHPVLST